MDDHIIPVEIRETISTLGYNATNLVPLYKLWSVVATKDGEHYNIQLNKDDMSVDSIHHLRFRWNATGAKIMDVSRTLVEQQG